MDSEAVEKIKKFHTEATAAINKFYGDSLGYSKEEMFKVINEKIMETLQDFGPVIDSINVEVAEDPNDPSKAVIHLTPKNAWGDRLLRDTMKRMAEDG